MSDNPAPERAPLPQVPRSELELYQARLRKAEALRALGVNPFAAGLPPGYGAFTAIAEPLAAHADSDAAALEAAKPRAAVAGRIVAERSFGKAGFLKLRDRSGELQVYVKKDTLGEAVYAVVKLAEVGDVVAAAGPLFRSKTGELTLHAEQFTVLTKALRPLPEKWHGLQDLETRYRQRYLDLVSNEEVRTVFRRRSAAISEIRRFLDARGYLEVETPMMHPLVSGASARPFTTHHNALDLDLYLRIAPELYLKRLVVGGFERVYEINRNFRNEGLSVRHNPEFTMLEFYQAYATYEDLMTLTEQLFARVAEAVLGSTSVSYQGAQLNFQGPFRRVSMAAAVRSAYPELAAADLGEVAPLQAALLANFRGTAKERQAVGGLSAGELLAKLFEERVEETLSQPTFVTHFPTAISPLARKSDGDPALVDRFELYAAGREIANAFTELNDPVDQRARFEAQRRKKELGDQEAMDLDEDYLRALEQGLPPTAGEGIGIDRLVMLLTDQPSIRDVILFPLLKKPGE